MTTESESLTVSHDEAEHLAKLVPLPLTRRQSVVLTRYISQNRERDAKLEAERARSHRLEVKLAKVTEPNHGNWIAEGLRADAAERQRDAILAALVKQRGALARFDFTSGRDATRALIRGLLADLDAAIKGAGESEPVCQNADLYGEATAAPTPPSDKRDGRIERLRAALKFVHEKADGEECESVKDLIFLLKDIADAANQALAADDAEAES